MRSQRARREEIAKNAKTVNLQYVPQKTRNFQGPTQGKCKKTVKCRVEDEIRKQITPREGFLLILAPFWDSLETLTSPKNS